MYACLYAPGNLALLLECARHFSPHVEETSADTVVFGVDGLGSLVGTPEEIARAIANRLGIPANVALAANPDVAVHAARGIAGVTVIPRGDEGEALGKLPVRLLEGDPDIAEILHAWGIRTFAEMGALPPLGVAARLGEEGVRLRELARGDCERRLRTEEEAPRFEESFELEDPVELLEPLSFLLARVLNDLCEQMARRGLAANEILLRLFLEDKTQHHATLKLPIPMRDAKAFLKLLQLELDARPPQCAVIRIFIGLEPVKPRLDQKGLFQPSSPEPDRLEIPLARLMNLLGAENVGSAKIRDTHRPDSFQIGRFSALPRPEKNQPIREGALALRRYRPLQHAQVICRDERPEFLTAIRVRGRILKCSGPWRTSGEWWMKEPWDRDEWDVALENQARQSITLYRIHEDRRTGRWFLEGSYD